MCIRLWLINALYLFYDADLYVCVCAFFLSSLRKDGPELLEAHVSRESLTWKHSHFVLVWVSQVWRAALVFAIACLMRAVANDCTRLYYRSLLF